MPVLRWAGLLLLTTVACRSAGDVVPDAPRGEAALLEASARTAAAFEARRLMEVCWPNLGESRERVTLTFIKQGPDFKDVTFQTAEGAPNSVGRCLQQIAWLYPWPAEGIPDTLTLAAPPVRPSGWVVLNYVTVLSERTFPSSRGILNAAPLVHACMANGMGMRASLRFRVQPQPVRVAAFTDLSEVAHPEARSTEVSRAVTDSERCVEAVLASTVYPGTRSFEFDFSDLSGAPAAAGDVSSYFAPKDAGPAPGLLESTSAQLGIAALRSQVSACWDAALERRSGLSGARSFRIRVTSIGKVAFSKVAEPLASEDEAVDFVLDACVHKAIAGARFDPPNGGAADFTYAWVFARRS